MYRAQPQLSEDDRVGQLSEPVRVESQPTVLGSRYVLGDIIGAGGSATVYHARDSVTGGEVAVKLFHTEMSESARHRHQQELRIFRELRHHGLVALYDAGTYRHRTYLVMSLIRGPSLSQRLFRDGSLTLAETMRIGAELGWALAYLHDTGITHRDIKPANVLLGEHGAALSDFGIAVDKDATQITDTGDLIGTAAYMAPEQVRGLTVDPQADVFALGLVLLECCTGIREYPGGMVESAVARLHRRPTIPEGLPATCGELLHRMTRQRPRARPSAAEVAVVSHDIATAAWAAEFAPPAQRNGESQ